MARFPTTKAQVSGQRFLLRRAEHAVVRNSVAMVHDPMRAHNRAVAVGVVIAVLIVVGCGVLALFRPQGKANGAPLVAVNGTGALFVDIDGTWHPVLNAASARLILGSPVSAQAIAEKELRTRPRGPMVGIPGAPTILPGDVNTLAAGHVWSWQICDQVVWDGRASLWSLSATGSIVSEVELTAAHLDGIGTGDSASTGMLYVVVEGVRWLVTDRGRARVNPEDFAVMNAYGLAELVPRPASRSFLDSLAHLGDLTAPEIPGRGAPPSFDANGALIGDVVVVDDSGGPRYLVVLNSGLQPVGPAIADVLAYGGNGGTQARAPRAVSLSAEVVGRAPLVTEVDFTAFPAYAGRVLDGDLASVVCSRWTKEGQAEPNRSVASAHRLPLPEAARVVMDTHADGGGPRLDYTWMPPGRGLVIVPTDLAGTNERGGALHLVTDGGLRFGLPSAETAAALGLGGGRVPVPWLFVSGLTQGVELTRENALVTHSALAADRFAGGPVEEGG